MGASPAPGPQAIKPTKFPHGKSCEVISSIMAQKSGQKAHHVTQSFQSCSDGCAHHFTEVSQCQGLRPSNPPNVFKASLVRPFQPSWPKKVAKKPITAGAAEMHHHSQLSKFLRLVHAPSHGSFPVPGPKTFESTKWPHGKSFEVIPAIMVQKSGQKALHGRSS